jgi:hypothetical protein
MNYSSCGSSAQGRAADPLVALRDAQASARASRSLTTRLDERAAVEHAPRVW